MKVLFTRHGETSYNVNHKHQGNRIDEALGSRGRRQALLLLPKLPKKLDVIFASPLKRAAQTAQVISKNLGEVPIEYRDELLERDYGDLTGMSWEKMNEKVGYNAEEKDNKLEYDYRPYGGESVEQVRERFDKFLDELRVRYKNKKILVVTHTGIIRLARACCSADKRAYVEHTEVDEIEI